MYKVIKLYFDPESIKFDSSQDVDGFHKALGRMCMFGFSYGAGSQDVQAIGTHIDKDKKITGRFHPVAPRTGSLTENGRFYALNDAFESFKQPRPLVVEAIPSKDDKGNSTWSFHS